MPIFNLTLWQTYYKRGFFNVSVEFERFFRREQGPVTLRFGLNGPKIEARIDRISNKNGTPRIHGHASLRDWFQKNFKCKDIIAVDLSSLEIIVLDRQADVDLGTIP